MYKMRDYPPKEPGEQFVAVYVVNGSLHSKTFLCAANGTYHELNEIQGGYFESSLSPLKTLGVQYIHNVEG